VMRKILIHLMDAQEFNTDVEQKATLDKLLMKVYDSDYKRKKAMDALKTVLDLRWASDAGDDSSHNESNLSSNRTLRDVLQMIFSKQTTAIVIENGQYCDELSWNELLLVVDMPVRVAILVTLCSLQTPGGQSPDNRNMSRKRAGTTESKAKVGDTFKAEATFGRNLRTAEFFESVESRYNCMILDLPPLTKSDVEKILCNILDIESVDVSIVKLVYDASSGNPFWSQLVANYIKDSGLEDFNDAYKNNRGRNPLHVVFICRLEKLAPDHQIIARYASIIGDEFTMPRLFNILPPNFQGSLEVCLSILSEYGFILCVGQNPPSYAFQNLLIRKFLYDLIPYRYFR
jgi:hypothetical protein